MTMLLQQTFRRTALSLATSVYALATLSSAARAGVKPVSAKEDVNRLPAAVTQLYRDTTLFPQKMKYRDIPWLLDLEKGIRVAKQEKRPVLIWTSGDDPLERC
jgi:hypothetical protein